MSRLLFIILALIISVWAVFGAGAAILNGSDGSFSQQVLLGNTNQGLKALLAEKKELNEAISNARALDSKIEELTEVRNNIKPEDITRLDKFIPSRIDNVNLVIDINNIASRHGMLIKNVKVETGGGEENKIPVSVDRLEVASSENVIADTSLSFSVSGNYQSLLSFLDDLANSLRVADVTSLAFSVDDKGTSQYDFQIKTYWVK